MDSKQQQSYQQDQLQRDQDQAAHPNNHHFHQHSQQQQQECVKEEEKQQQQQQQQEEEEEEEVTHQQPTTSYQYSLQLSVPPGQLELGRRLITAMYSSSPNLSDLEAPQLMQLAALAECYGVGKVVTAAADQLHQISMDAMPLNIAAAVFELPEACLALPAFEMVCQTAADKLQQELGDLEVVWADTLKRETLMSLPLEALLQLLRDDRTQVAGEDTAVFTAMVWLNEHPAAVSRAPQLLAVLRLPHCTPTHLSQPPIRSRLREWGLSEDEACDVCAMAALPDRRSARWVELSYSNRAAWLLPRRPVSCVKQVQVQWQTSLGDLQSAFELTMRDGRYRLLPPEISGVVWNGRVWRGGVFVSNNPLQGEFGMYVSCPDGRACCDVEGIWSSRLAPDEDNAWAYQDVHLDDRADLLHSRGHTSWAQLRQRLEDEQLVHPGEQLHIQYTVRNVQ
jgi:hypothetical protein